MSDGKVKSKFNILVTCLVIIGLAGITALILIKSRSLPQRHARPQTAPLVETMVLTARDHQVTLLSHGTVKAAQSITLTPQVSGRVTSLAPGFVVGAFFAEGELLFTIEKSDYRLQLEQAKAEQAKAELDLELIKGQASIARREWQRQDPAPDSEPLPLVVFEPQLRNAQAKVKAAAAGVKLARLNLARTTVKAPFACFIASESVDVGQYVGKGEKLGQLHGTDWAVIKVSLAVNDLKWLELPEKEGDWGSAAQLTLGSAPAASPGWSARLYKLLAEIDPASRMAKMLFAVRDPYQLAVEGEGGERLAVGSFVKVAIMGKSLPDVMAIPRSAILPEGGVWLVAKESTLVKKELTVLFADQQHVYVRGQVAPGDRLVTSSLVAAAPGQRVRTSSGDQERPSRGKAGPGGDVP
ncbi:MAG: efflux RND transporter periplasmic adaptor subunit [Thermodesulfobacteriota bacterium]